VPAAIQLNRVESNLKVRGEEDYESADKGVAFRLNCQLMHAG
jgi:hypothetical protein